MGNDNAITRQEAQELGRRMQGLAARQAELAYDFLAALGEFDARGAIAHYQGIKSSAHFVAWACSMSAGTAREHVRVARALRGLPQVSALMRQGRLSYSKVRELTRVTDHLAEDALCELASEMTASQLARTVAAYRSAAGTRVQNLVKRRFTVKDSPDGMVRITIVLAPEEAALVTAAVEAAARRSQPPPVDVLASSCESRAEPQVGVPAGTFARSSNPSVRHQVGDLAESLEGGAVPADVATNSRSGQSVLEGVPAGTPARPVNPPDRVQAILDVAASYLDTLPTEPSDDHTLVMVHVNAAQILPAAPVALWTTNEGVSARPVVGAEQVKCDESADSRSLSAALIPDSASESDADRDADRGTGSDIGNDAGSVSESDNDVDRDSGSETGHRDAGAEPLAEHANPTYRGASLDELVCHVEGHGPIEPATAQRLACTSTLLGVLLGPDGDVLRLGRTRRLASRAQRRALRIRDKGVCQFPGCAQTAHLDAHHLTPWSAGGRTDLDAMILLCRRHHVHVHEGGVQLTRQPGSWRRFHFALPDGRPITGTWLAEASPDALEQLLAGAATRANEREPTAANNHASREQDCEELPGTESVSEESDLTDPTRIFPPHAGVGFNLHECVRVLFDIQQPEPATAA